MSKKFSVCPYCTVVVAQNENGIPGMCPGCAHTGHLYRLVDDGEYGIAWLRARWQASGYAAGLARLARAERAYREAVQA